MTDKYIDFQNALAIALVSGGSGGSSGGRNNDDKSWQRTQKITDKTPIHVNVTVEIIREEG